MAQVYAAKYLAKAALSAPRDLVNSYVGQVHPAPPDGPHLPLHVRLRRPLRDVQQLDARQPQGRHDARADRAASSAPTSGRTSRTRRISGGEPTTRNDLVDICRVMIDKFPKLRKLTLNTTGLTPHRAHPDADQDRRDVPRAQRHLLDARVDRRRRRHARRGAQREARLREGRQDHRGDAGAAEDATASTSASRRRSSR